MSKVGRHFIEEHAVRFNWNVAITACARQQAHALIGSYGWNSVGGQGYSRGSTEETAGPRR